MGMTTDDAVNGLVAAFKAGKWGVAVGSLLVVLTQVVKYLAGLLKKEIPKNAQPWIAASLGVASAIGLSLATGIVWWEAVIGGIVFGATAGGLWSMVVKHFAKKNA